MQLFPIMNPRGYQVNISPLPLCKDAAWDFKSGRPLFRNGEPIIVTGVEAVKVWIWKAIKTQRARYEMYSWDFGSEIESLIGQNYSDALKVAEIKRYVRETLDINPYIEEINNINIEFSQGNLTIDVVVTTIYGEVEMFV